MKSMLKTLTTVCVLALSLTLGGMSAANAAKPNRNQNWSHRHILFLIWSYESNPFFGPMVNGVKDAEKAQDVTVDIKYGNENMARMKNIIETAIANGTDGLAVTIPDDNALKDVLCNAMKKGIPVIAFNIDDSHHGAPGSTCRLAFVGQDFVKAGYALGKLAVKQFHLGKGDLVFTPVEAPQAVYAVQRHAGVAKALAEVGAKTEILGTGNDHAKALSLMTQYLLGHPDTKAVIGLGQTPTSQAVRAIKQAGLNIPAAGFDISQGIIQNLENDKLAAAVDQQPYTQGYYTIAQMADLLKFGLAPSSMATGGLITKDNVGLAKKWAGITR